MIKRTHPPLANALSSYSTKSQVMIEKAQKAIDNNVASSQMRDETYKIFCEVYACFPKTNVTPKFEISENNKDILLGTVLTDGMVVYNGKNVLFQLQQSEINITVLSLWLNELNFVCTDYRVIAGDQKNIKSPNLSLQVRTNTSKANTAFGSEFKKDIYAEKVLPSTWVLKKYLTYRAIAWMIMFDGSRKSSHGKQMELHIQNLSLKDQARLCYALYRMYNIKCWPSFYGLSEQKKEEQYHIQISGMSLDILREKVMPYCPKDIQERKFPSVSTRTMTPALEASYNLQSKFDEFLKNYEDLLKDDFDQAKDPADL